MLGNMFNFIAGSYSHCHVRQPLHHHHYTTTLSPLHHYPITTPPHHHCYTTTLSPHHTITATPSLKCHCVQFFFCFKQKAILDSPASLTHLYSPRLKGPQMVSFTICCCQLRLNLLSSPNCQQTSSQSSHCHSGFK